MSRLRVPGYCSAGAAGGCCGLSLRNASLWIAEVCAEPNLIKAAGQGYVHIGATLLLVPRELFSATNINVPVVYYGQVFVALIAAALQSMLAAPAIGLGLILLSSVSAESVRQRLGRAAGAYWAELFYVPIGFGVFQLSTSALMAYGVLTRRQLLLIPWLVFHALQTALLLLGSLGSAVLLAAHLSPLPLGHLVFLAGLAYAELFRHLLLVVLAHCRELRDADPLPLSPPPPPSSPAAGAKGGRRPPQAPVAAGAGPGTGLNKLSA